MTPCYVVTDIEVDGPIPGKNSMLALASVAVDSTGRRLGEFQVTVAALPDATSDPHTFNWWHNHPEAYIAATTNAQPAEKAIGKYVKWVRSLPGDPVFASHPLAMDAPWIDHYLQRFAGIRFLKGPWDGERLFHGGGMCLKSYAAGRLGWPLWQCSIANYRDDWLGHQDHTHKAIDDARGYAYLLAHLLTLRE